MATRKRSGPLAAALVLAVAGVRTGMTWTVRAQGTPPVPGAVLTSKAQGDVVCAETFGAGWRPAEFHDAGGWSFWANGSLPAGARFWTAINDQPANPWNSVGTLPTPDQVTPPKFLTAEQPVVGQFIASLAAATAEDQLPAVATSPLGAYGTALDAVRWSDRSRRRLADLTAAPR